MKKGKWGVLSSFLAWKEKKSGRAWASLLAIMILLGLGVGSVQAAPAGKQTGETEKLTVHFLDVGQGDCTLITCGSDAMLIDAGDNNQGTRIQNYLKKQGIKTLDYVIGTHPDADHIGGLDVILYKFNCETILMTDEQKDTNTYRDVVSTMKTKGYKNTLPVVGQAYELGDAEFTIVGPSVTGSDSNNNSIAILLTHGKNKFLFTGDAETEEEQEIMNCGISIEADVYKAGHHGSRTASSREFLEAVSPEYALISCGEGNSYGHPHAETMNSFRSMGVQVFRTDEQGTVIASSDGRTISWNCPPSDSWLAGEPIGTQTNSSASGTQNETQAPASETAGAALTGKNKAAPAAEKPAPPAAAVEEPATPAEPAQNPATVNYICNTNTGKFHYPSCSSVKQMSEKNKLPFTGSRDEAIAQGYEACKKCNP